MAWLATLDPAVVGEVVLGLVALAMTREMRGVRFEVSQLRGDLHELHTQLLALLTQELHREPHLVKELDASNDV